LRKSKYWFDDHSGSLKRLSGEQLEIALAEHGLHRDGALRVRVPVLQHLPERLQRIGHLVRIADLLGAVLAGLEVGRDGAAAFLDQSGEVPGQRLHIHIAGVGRRRHGAGAVGRLRRRAGPFRECAGDRQSDG
jgi:hypothetical protein